MQKTNKKVKRIGKKMGSITTYLLVVCMAVVTAVCMYQFYQLVFDMQKDRCVNGTNMLAYELERYPDSEDKTELLDRLKEEMRCEFTIFDGRIREYTTLQENGERIVGTELSDRLTEIIINQGKSYVGYAKIGGMDLLASYVPTYGEDGKITGLIFAGISRTEAMTQIKLTVGAVVFAGIIMTIISILLITIFLRNVVSVPLAKITKLAQMIEGGELKEAKEQLLRDNIRSNDEIGILSHSFGNMIHILTNYIEEISFLLENMAKGNLSVTIDQDYVGDFDSIKVSLEDILGNMNNTMSQIIDSSAYVSSGSKQMAAGAQALAQGSTEQASAVEELEGTIHTINEQVNQTAENAHQATEAVDDVSRHILESNDKMQEMILAMDEINASSNEIEKIIRTIENIASQTNILALNAAVEAARAGEVGKGFAVVAQEVRELAGKSAEASKSTAQLIQRSITSVKQGTEIVNDTAEHLQTVVESTDKVVSKINEIAEASGVQAESISEVRERISQISDVVQTNSATSEQSAATSQELSTQANILKNLVSMFRLRG